jgi:hypothetical protein
MQTLHPADRVIRPDRVEVPAELEAEIRGIEVGRPRGRGLWWAVAALVVAIAAVVLWPAAPAAELHDSWTNVPVGLMPIESEIHDSWFAVPADRMPTPTPASLIGFELHDSWMTAPVGLMPMGLEIHDSWVTAPVGLMPTGFEIHDSWVMVTP